ncbi:MAG: transcription-repair coupling factor [Dehalococcoidia bacterium]|nr:transcription-repair coupling factor [Dehalococcoidia bacterium]
MNTKELLALTRESSVFCTLVERLALGSSQVSLIEEAKPYLLASLFVELKRPLLVVTSHPSKMRKLAEQIEFWIGEEHIIQIAEPCNLPYTRTTLDALSSLDRIQALSRLIDMEENKTPAIIVASVQALLQKLPSAAAFRSGKLTLTKGMALSPIALVEKLVLLGYCSESLVEVPGCFSRRGDILDIFPPTEDAPLRLEFFGNSLERLCTFEPQSQRSVKSIEQACIWPASEMAPHFIGGMDNLQKTISALDISALNADERVKYEIDIEFASMGQLPDMAGFYSPLFNTDALLSFLPPLCITVLDEPNKIQLEAEYLDIETRKAYEEKLNLHEIPDVFPSPYFTWNEMQIGLECAQRLEFVDNEPSVESEALSMPFRFSRNYAGQLPLWIKHVKELLANNKRLIVISHQAARLEELLHNEEVIALSESELEKAPQQGSIILVQGLLSAGWQFNDNIYLFTDNELFGFLKQRRLARRRHVAQHKHFSDFSSGEFVVHIEHGVGKYCGITTMSTSGNQLEYMMVEYAGGDKLYVPTDQIDRLEPYIGAGDYAPALNRLGSQEWFRRKEKARESAEDIAGELLEIYAAREMVEGFAYSTDNPWQMELEASFPYIETADQLSAIAQIKDDMARSRPMDRLVCGDVGYGKTEVALRAAFKAIQDSKQVAVLVPTTVLAQQHYTTFKERLAAFPVRVESLSRFKAPKEQKEIVAGIEDGKVDLVIGTHRLLQKDIKFKDLGLLIIDEEQRFGVTHKEHFKILRQEVDVLTLSATPIPRTLNLSLVGVRDMSVMETPPSERLPIKTYVAEYSESLMREAIKRELDRNGQVFLVHNRVQSIGMLAEKLKMLVPEARIAVGHGQMPEDELETVMLDFSAGVVDVLLCTTIIESGLDMPNANTLIVNQADRMGLTQLYQLRGRIGRGASTAYAYFFYDKGKRLTIDAAQRLQTIAQATELGAGFGIAMRDLKIRGAGNILGAKQSGHINSVGFNLYTQLLADAVEELKLRDAAQREGKPFVPPLRLPYPTISLPDPAFIPNSYVSDVEMRLSLYRKLAGVKCNEEIDVVTSELIDRFGELPQEVRNLLYAIRLKIMGSAARLESITTEQDEIVLRRPHGMQFPYESQHIMERGVRVSLNQVRIDTSILVGKWQEVLEGVIRKLGTQYIDT